MSYYAHCNIEGADAAVMAVFKEQKVGKYDFITGAVALGDYNPTCRCLWTGTQVDDAVDGVIQTDGPFVLIVDYSMLPTADPAVVGHAWNNSGVLNISAG